MRFFILLAMLGMGLVAHATLSSGSEKTDPYFLLAEIFNDSTPPAPQTALDESGWDGQVEQLDSRGLEQYVSASQRIDAVAAVGATEQSKCKPQRGIASWYGGSFQGEKTANGETFDTNKKRDMTAAHKKLPFGTKVRVTNIHNGLSVIVRINDRGPFVHGRVIDVSHAAAKALHLDGVGPVMLTCL